MASKTKAPDPTQMTPKQFFEKFVAQRYEEAVARLPEIRGFEVVIRADLEGKGGGCWDLAFRGGKAKITAGGGETPDVTFVQTVEDWRDVLAGRLGGPPELLPMTGDPVDLFLLDKDSQGILRGLKGTVLFTVAHFCDRDWKVKVHFGPGAPKAEPDTRITVSAMDFEALAGQAITPQKLMGPGGFDITGDFVLAANLATIVFNKVKFLKSVRSRA